jgi:gluconolactonase
VRCLGQPVTALGRDPRVRMTWRFERAAGPFTFTEGPVWDDEAVHFTDIPSSRIMVYFPATSECRTFRENTEGANGLALDRNGRLYGCEGYGRRVVRYEAAGGITALADHFEDGRLNSPNDIVVDSAGRIWFTDPRYGDRHDMELDHESVYRLDPRPEGSYEIARVTFDTRRPNGLALSGDERTLYVAESPRPVAPRWRLRGGARRQLRGYPVNDDASLGLMYVLHDFGPYRGIDGMCIDAEGSVLAACGSRRGGPGPRIAVFSASGDLLEEHPTPADPTNVCFGGPDLSDVYVTAVDGGLWRAHTDRQGLPTHPGADRFPRSGSRSSGATGGRDRAR